MMHHCCENLIQQNSHDSLHWRDLWCLSHCRDLDHVLELSLLLHNMHLKKIEPLDICLIRILVIFGLLFDME